MAHTPITISKAQAQSFAAVLCRDRIKSFAQSHPDYPAFVEEERKRQEQKQANATNIKQRVSRKQKVTTSHLQSC